MLTSIRNYLSVTNVQLGATYKVSVQSTNLNDEGFKAGAKYINASEDEIGKFLSFSGPANAFSPPSGLSSWW